MPDYPHGTVSRSTAGCHCDTCRRASSRYQNMRRLDIAHGRPRTVAVLGVRRRLRSLGYMGWSCHVIAARLGVSTRTVEDYLYKRKRVKLTTFEKISALYDELCMIEPVATTALERRGIAVTKSRARLCGAHPPLAWLDIDDPNEDPSRPLARDDTVDDVLVQRILDGDRELARHANKAEKCEVARRWLAAGKSLSSLEWTGWRVDRYKPRATPDGRWVQVGNRRVWEAGA